VAKFEFRYIHDIALEVRAIWRSNPSKANYRAWAAPYLEAMLTMRNVNTPYYLDSGREIVLYFLSNTTGWKGADARRIKKELRDALAGTPPIASPRGWEYASA
jgi:hypothetical protein